MLCFSRFSFRRTVLLLTPYSLLLLLLLTTPALAQDAPVIADTVEAATPQAQPETAVEEAEPARNFGFLSILPPLIAIVVALMFKRVIPALFLGIWLGAWIAAGSLGGIVTGLGDVMVTYVVGALADADHAAIIIFSLMIGGMVGMISRNGGMQGVVNKIVRWASTPKKGQIATGLLGFAIFFDDYANTLVIGNTMRPVTDRLRVSREKLAYLVDTTAAPVACLAFVTTWIGYEVGLIGDAVNRLPGYDEAPYEIFIQSIPYSFYPILALFFVFVVAATRREFGPMYTAETRARTTGQVLAPDARVDEAAAEGKEVAPIEGKPHKAINAIVPILALVGTVIAGLFITGGGEGKSVQDIIGDANSYTALMWGSLAGVLAAALMSLRTLTVDQTMDAWYAGLKSMLFAMIILVLAWALSAVTETLNTAGYLVSIMGETVPPGLIPAIAFVLAAATAFATGTSWGTMGILMPLVIPLAWAILDANGMAAVDHHYLIHSAVASVLAGAVWGDHCSPISDTTILSSMASGCDHIAHVRTQLPYAMSVGLVALFVGIIPTGFGFPAGISLLIGAVLLVVMLRFFGKVVPEEPVTV